jgi:hypothetical protein
LVTREKKGETWAYDDLFVSPKYVLIIPSFLCCFSYWLPIDGSGTANMYTLLKATDGEVEAGDYKINVTLASKTAATGGYAFAEWWYLTSNRVRVEPLSVDTKHVANDTVESTISIHLKKSKDAVNIILYKGYAEASTSTPNAGAFADSEIIINSIEFRNASTQGKWKTYTYPEPAKRH